MNIKCWKACAVRPNKKKKQKLSSKFLSPKRKISPTETVDQSFHP